MSLYECERPDCEWKNPNWHWGFADAGATWAMHERKHELADEASK
jgi:hypothetical protein